MQRALLVTVASATVASAFVTAPITRMQTVVRSSEPNGMSLLTSSTRILCSIILSIDSYGAPSTDYSFLRSGAGAEAAEPAVTEAAAAEAAAAEPAAVAPPVVLLNGWAPNSELACFGLPGALAPTGYFDPLGFAQPGIGLNDVKRNRESEVRTLL